MFRRLALWTLAITAVAGAIAAIGFLGGPPPKNPFEYDISAYKKTAPRLLLFRETGQIRITGAQCLAVGPEDRIYVGGDRGLSVFDAAGKPITAIELPLPVKCAAVDQAGNVYLGMRDHVEIYGAGLDRGHSWPSLGMRAVITSIAVAGNEVFIADAGNRLIHRCDSSGKVLVRIGDSPGDTRFIVPSPYFDVAVGPDGKLWAVNPGKHTIDNYSCQGVRQGGWGEAAIEIQGFCGCCNPTHLAVLPDGRFVTGEKGIPRIKLYSAQGVFIGVIGEEFAGDTFGADLAADSKGRVLVLDPKAGAVRIFVENK